MYLKIFIILFFLLYQNGAYSKATDKNDFNQKYLSNYFSALISSNNQKNDDAIKFFNSSKFLINKHDNFLREYVFSLILEFLEFQILISQITKFEKFSIHILQNYDTI